MKREYVIKKGNKIVYSNPRKLTKEELKPIRDKMARSGTSGSHYDKLREVSPEDLPEVYRAISNAVRKGKLPYISAAD